MPQIDLDVIWPEPIYPPCIPIPPKYLVENLDDDTRLDLIHFIERNCGAVYMELGGYSLVVRDEDDPDMPIETNEQENFENLSDAIWECEPRSYYEPPEGRKVDICGGHLPPKDQFTKPCQHERFFHQEEMIMHILKDHFHI